MGFLSGAGEVDRATSAGARVLPALNHCGTQGGLVENENCVGGEDIGEGQQEWKQELETALGYHLKGNTVALVERWDGLLDMIRT